MTHRKALLIIRSVAFTLVGAIACLLVGGIHPANAVDLVTPTLRTNGFAPREVVQEGQEACRASSADNNFFELQNASEHLEAYQKRERLVAAAVGFAELYARQENHFPNNFLSLDQPGSCSRGNFVTQDCISVADLMRTLSKLGPNADWCAAFIATLSKMIDEQWKGPPNLLHSEPGSSDARNYASALKLLAIFNPKYRTMMAWGKKPPTPHPENFLAPNVAPIPGCTAIFLDTSAPRGSWEGHVGLVVSVSNGHMTTVEGNSVSPHDSSARGIFLHSGRPWGENATFKAANGDRMIYEGCVMPWPGDSAILASRVCSEAVNLAETKNVFFSTIGSPWLQGSPGRGSVKAGTLGP